MDELLAGYANYASTEAILEERQTAQDHAHPDTSITITVTASWSWTITFTFTW
jgi:hypothetical protein